jgi:hypothetical protein
MIIPKCALCVTLIKMGELKRVIILLARRKKKYLRVLFLMGQEPVIRGIMSSVRHVTPCTVLPMRAF